MGGVVSLFSPVLLDEDCVGRIMRARKPSSTLLVRLGVADSWRVVLTGGGPTLGLVRAATIG